MFIHTVLWNLKKNKTKQDYQKIATILLELKSSISVLKDIKIGYTSKTIPENARQICLITTFDNENDYIVYRDHEEHIKVKNEIQKVFEARVVSDVKIEA